MQKYISIILFLFNISCVFAQSDSVDSQKHLETSVTFNTGESFLRFRDTYSEIEKVAMPLSQTKVNIGTRYKGLGIDVGLPFLSFNVLHKENSQNSNFKLSYYSSKWGGDFYQRKLAGYMGESGAGTIYGMEQKIRSLNIYRKIYGKYDLDDYFFYPLKERVTKFGAYAMASMERQRLNDFQNIFNYSTDRDARFTNLQLKNVKLSVGTGCTFTFFINPKFYYSQAIFASVALNNVNTNDTYAEDLNFKKSYLGFGLFGKPNLGYLGKNWEMNVSGYWWWNQEGEIYHDIAYNQVEVYFEYKFRYFFNRSIKVLDKYLK